jgi:hypothetical protein
MEKTPSTPLNTTFLARYNKSQKGWEVMNTVLELLTFVGESKQVDLFVQQYCQLNYLPENRHVATIYWSEHQSLW